MHPEVRTRSQFAKRATKPSNTCPTAGAQNSEFGRSSTPTDKPRNPCSEAKFEEDPLSAQTGRSRFTRGRSVVRSHVRPSETCCKWRVSSCPRWHLRWASGPTAKRLQRSRDRPPHTDELGYSRGELRVSDSSAESRSTSVHVSATGVRVDRVSPSPGGPKLLLG